MNAYTSKEHTCYYARVLDEHVGFAVEILADMLLNSVFAPDEMEKEKSVVLEEIKMYEDSPDEIVHDLFAEGALIGHPLGQSVLGHEETVSAIGRQDVLDYIEERYVGQNLVVAAAGQPRPRPRRRAGGALVRQAARGASRSSTYRRAAPFATTSTQRDGTSAPLRRFPGVSSKP